MLRFSVSLTRYILLCYFADPSPRAKWDRYRNTDPSTIFKPSDIADFETNQKSKTKFVSSIRTSLSGIPSVVFLQTLQSYNALPETHVDAIANIYGFCDNPNVEISFPFYQVALQDPTSSAARNYMPRALDWVVGKTDGMVKGRMKYNRPIFVAASKVDYDYTVKMFRDHQDAFHPIAQSMIEKVRVPYCRIIMCAHAFSTGS